MSDSTLAKLLIVDDEVAQMRALCDTLEPHGYVIRGFSSASEALATLKQEHFDLLLTDLMMPEMDGIALLRASQEIDRDLACIVMTGHGTIATAVSALKAGALDYILKPFRMNHILPALARALGTRQLQLENIRLRESVAIYELSRAITKGLTHDEIVQQTLRAALGLSDAGAAYVLVAAAEPHSLHVAGCAGAGSEPLQGLSYPIRPETEQWVLKARQDLDCLDGDLEPTALFAHPLGAQIQVALPIVAGDQLYGVLGVSFARPERRVSRGQLRALDILARTAATAFETASHVSQLRDMNEVLESRVRERTRELEIANKDLESFSYSVSHDLREPLRAVEGFCELFRSEFEAGVPEGGRRLLERIWSGASRMNQLINDLLHFSRFGREPLNCLRVPLREMILRIVSGLQERAGQRQVIVQIEELPDCYGDRALLEQVMINLLSNAFKFSAGRPVARVEVGSLRQGERIVYYVRDNGVGFDMKYADKLFGVFQRLHSKEAFEGTGIGLSIVHRIIQRHGGSVWADSRADDGTTLYFSLPHEVERCAA
jgi:signal transduction histidine kinase/CheY-like chemotaxis protein